VFGIELPHLVLIPAPWDLLLSGLLPFVIAALLLPDNFMMPKNDNGDFHDGTEAQQESESARKRERESDRRPR
jgi:hypothetical protein